MIDLEKERMKAIQNMINRVSIHGAVQHNNVYAIALNDIRRDAFRRQLAGRLSELYENRLCKKDYTEEQHYNTIQSFADMISAYNMFGPLLTNNRLMIGTSQKLINLYWKMRWVLLPGTPPPHHCPMEGIIIRELEQHVQKVKWTKMDSMEIYRDLVASAKRIAGPELSIAEWELETYGLRTE